MPEAMNGNPSTFEVVHQEVFPRQQIGDVIFETLPIQERQRIDEEAFRAAQTEALDEYEDL
jgi:hypothetical protein